jgi:hypothetical protein
MIDGDMERKHNINLLLLSVLLLMTAACSTTRNLPEDETLYVGVKNMEILNEDKTPAGVQTLEEVEAALSYPPNNAILGSNSLRFPIPFGLWIYNDFVKYQDKKGVGHWIFNKLGSTPVYLSTVNPETRVKVATNLLHDYGFFNGAVTYSVDSLKNPRKAKLSYKIDMANPYYLDSVMYLKYPPRADSLIRAAYDQRVLHKGDNFSVLKLEEERQRLSTLFRNNGYYYFRPEFITFRADTLRKPGMVSLQVVPKAGVPADAKRPYYIGNTSVYLTGYKGEEPTDSIVFPGMTLHYSGKKPGIRPGVLAKRFFYQKGQLYSQARQNFTQEALARLGIFKFAEFRYAPQDTLPGCDTLNVRMNATFDLPYDGELEFNVTTKNTDQTGPGAIFSLSRKNFMRTAATLSFQLKGSYEWQTNSTADGNSSKLNSYELGTSFSLEYPRLVLPWMSKKMMSRQLSSATIPIIEAGLCYVFSPYLQQSFFLLRLENKQFAQVTHLLAKHNTHTGLYILTFLILLFTQQPHISRVQKSCPVQITQDRETVFHIRFQLHISGFIQITILFIFGTIRTGADRAHCKRTDTVSSPNIELLAVRRYSLVPICIQNSPHQTSGYMLFLSDFKQTTHFRCHFQELRIRTV